MITKNELKYFVSLHQKKHRRQENKFLVEGEKIVKEGILSKYACEVAFMTNEFFSNNEELIKFIKQRQIKIEIIKNQEFEKLSDTKSPQGIAAVFINKRRKFILREFENENVLVYLDNISDPGNVGSILRSCDWFGIKNVFISINSAEYLNPKVIRSSMGSIFHLNIFEDFDFEELAVFKQNGFKILCTDLNGKSIFSLIKPGKSIIVFSNESTGPSSDVLNFADEKITIPGSGKAESLNVASAAAVILAQLTKK